MKGVGGGEKEEVRGREKRGGGVKMTDFLVQINWSKRFLSLDELGEKHVWY